MKKLSLFIWLNLLGFNALAQNNTIKITFLGKQYNDMTLKLDKFKARGNTIDNNTWEFSFPDSAFQRQSAMNLIATYNDSVYHSLIINAIKDQDTIGMGSFGLPANFNDTLYFQSRFEEKNSPLMKGQGIFIEDIFVLNRYFPEFDLWYEWTKIIGQKNFVDTHKKIIQNDPKSHYSMVLLGKTLFDYPTKNDVRMLYNIFDEETKSSFYGLKVKAFLDTLYPKDYFNNIELVNSRTYKLDSLINDFNKPTFIIFSASWCGPCHELAPKLKQMYYDLKNDVNFVYVTTDKKEDIEKWNAFLDKQNITWRSLASYQKDKDILQQFSVNFIPYTILVMPNRAIKVLDVRQEDHKEELYKLKTK